MGRGKHASDDGIDLSGIPFKQIILGIIVIAILFGIGFGGFNLVKKLTSKKTEEPKDIEESLGMIKSLEGYDVLGKIKVENLGIETYIVDSVEEGALKVAAGKINGGNLNKTGNFCVVGHNYENIFAKLLEIEKGNIVTVIDPEMKETKYEVVDIYTVEPDELDALLSVDDTVRLTLITCEMSASTRLVVVAEKLDDSQIDNKTENIVE